ncbi:hypothetical protein [Promicromonospora sp. NFX87]|uniref:hypothetical protein n=1 Tax=Promicromonospora sp. NFX87 TaxID=3402691 RepID=UPI003AFB7B6F
MAVPESVRAAHSRVAPLLAELQRYVEASIRPFATERGFLFTDRIKSVESLAEKLESGRFDAWSEVNDLYACTIVVPISEHELTVVEHLDSVFTRLDLKSRSTTQKAPDVFRFDGLRWYGRMREDVTEFRQPGLDQVTFEVQVITALEWAWTQVTHNLVYKGEHADWKHQRMAAHLKATIEQAELLVLAYDSTSEVVNPSPDPLTDSAGLVARRFHELSKQGAVPEALIPDSWKRFAENFVSLIKSYRPTDLVAEVERVIAAVEEELADTSRVPASGTLFQIVLAYVARSDTPGHIRRFSVVRSRELTDIHGVRDVPRAFRFDGLASGSSPVPPD